MNDDTPNPGSAEAVARGCTCPRLDNAHGLGFPYYGGQVCFWYNANCPLHATRTKQERSEHE